MEKPVIDQLICALVSIGGGIAFGVIYDLFKALRLRLKSLLFSVLADVFFCFLGLCLLFLLFMSIGGGEARLYIVLCSAFGALAYFISASAAILDFFIGVLNAIVVFFLFLAKPFAFASRKLKKLYKKVKMFFQKSCNWFTIMVKGKVGDKGKKPLPEQDAKKEQGHEAKTRRPGNKNRHPRSRGVRGNKPVSHKAANRKRAGKTQ